MTARLLKYALYGLLGFELSQVGAGLDNPLWFFAILITVLIIEQLGIIQATSRRF